MQMMFMPCSRQIATEGGRRGPERRHSQHPPFFMLLLALFPVALCFAACAPNNGIFAGGNWQLSGLQHQHIHTLVLDFNNTQLLYAGDAEHGVFVSTDSGQHWAQRSAGLPLPLTIFALSFDTTGKKLYAATNKGIFVSTNAAQQWTSVGQSSPALPADDYTALAFDGPHTIYAGTAHHGVLVSTDDGSMWSEAATGLPTNDAINGLTFDSTLRQLWAATMQGIYRSNDGGKSWQAFNTGLPANSVVYTVQVATSSGGAPGLVFAGTDHGIYHSEDSGAHWARSQEALAGTGIRFILIDFRTPTTLYVATDVGAFRSDDNGQNWRGIASGLPRGKPVYALLLGASDYSQLYAAANDVYLYPGTSNDFTFARIFPIVIVLAFFFLLYLVAQRSRNRRREVLKPERIIESPPPPAPTNGNNPSS